MAIEKGDIERLEYTLRNSAGTLYDPTGAGRVVFKMRLPDGTITTYTWIAAGGGDAQISRVSAGLFRVDWTVTQVGKHFYKFQAYSDTAADANSLEVEYENFVSVNSGAGVGL